MWFGFVLFISWCYLPYLNKYCNVMQMYGHVQFYITSLEYCSLSL